MNKIRVVGKLIIDSQEGGFAQDAILINDKPITEFIAMLFDMKTNSRGSLGDYLDLGNIELKMRKIK
jgi:hypothetical protein